MPSHKIWILSLINKVIEAFNVLYPAFANRTEVLKMIHDVIVGGMTFLDPVQEWFESKYAASREQDERRRKRTRVARSENVGVISKVERTAVRRSLRRLVRH
jgi:hypothetical protein